MSNSSSAKMDRRFALGVASLRVYRVVDGCNAAFILYETVYEIPRIGFRQHAYTGVTYSHDGHRWLAIADQGTPLP